MRPQLVHADLGGRTTSIKVVAQFLEQDTVEMIPVAEVPTELIGEGQIIKHGHQYSPAPHEPARAALRS